MEAENVRLREQIAAWVADVPSLREQRDALQLEIAALSDENDELQATVDGLDEYIDSLYAQRTRLGQYEVTLGQDNEDLRDDIQGLQVDYAYAVDSKNAAVRDREEYEALYNQRLAEVQFLAEATHDADFEYCLSQGGCKYRYNQCYRNAGDDDPTAKNAEIIKCIQGGIRLAIGAEQLDDIFREPPNWDDYYPEAE